MSKFAQYPSIDLTSTSQEIFWYYVSSSTFTLIGDPGSYGQYSRVRKLYWRRAYHRAGNEHFLNWNAVLEILEKNDLEGGR